MNSVMNVVDSQQLLSPLKPWLENPEVSEIMMNRPGEIYVESRGEVRRHAVVGLHMLHVMRALRLVANENEKVFDAHAPLLSARLYNQSRIQAVLPPVSKTVCFSIRKHTETTRSWDELMVPDYFRLGVRQQRSQDPLRQLLDQKKWSEFLREAVRLRKTILIAGETGSGKTTLLGTLLSVIDRSERIVVLEDTQELPPSKHNSLSLLARDDDFLQKPITLSELLSVSLRLRPDRIVLGELRGGEAYDFISACQTGHGGSMATIHAASPAVALERLVQLYLLRSGSTFPLELLRQLVKDTVDVVVQLSRRSGRPRVEDIYYQE